MPLKDKKEELVPDENNIDQDGLIDSFRTSCLKDYFVNDNSSTNSSYVNDIYTASIISSSNGWQTNALRFSDCDVLPLTPSVFL